MGDEDRRVWTVERLKRKQQQIINQTKTEQVHRYECRYECSCLTMAAAADVQQAGLSAGAEAFVGGIICSVCKHRFRGNEAKQWDTFHLA